MTGSGDREKVMNLAYRKDCVYCANYVVDENDCSLNTKCVFTRLATIRRNPKKKKDEVVRDLLGNEVMEK